MSARNAGDSQLDPTAKRVADFMAREIDANAEQDAGAQPFALRLNNFRLAQRRWRLSLIAAAAVALLVIGLGASQFRNEPPDSKLSYLVDDREPPNGGYLVASNSAPSVLSFSDGSEVRLSSRTRGRVVEVNHDGARFALENGNVAVDIEPRPHSRWLFEAGPFLVKVHGTSFSLSWNPTENLFELQLRTGAVSVTDPLGGPETRLRAGQVLWVNLRDRTSNIGPIVTSVSAPSAAGSALVPGAATENLVSPLAAASASAHSVAWSHRGWSTTLGAGNGATVLSEAEQLGLSTVLLQADGEDLWALANAARYAERYALAERALKAHRKRFPSSSSARAAAFFLGRLHDEDSTGPDVALGWYEQYLREAPGGTHASDAFGRKMTLLRQWHRQAEALLVAHEYLRRFPGGTYANAARVLVRAETGEK
jgi:TolA-binding protein